MYKRKIVLLVTTAVALVSAGVCGIVRSEGGDARGDGANVGLVKRVEDLTADVRRLEAAVNESADRVVPVGTVVAFAGDWPPKKADDKTPWEEADLGWMACDGRALRKADYVE